MAARKKTTPKNFKAAYQILKTNAEALQNSNEPDIDNLMKTVEQSINAYKVCQARIEAVQQALDAAFDKDTDDTVVETTDETLSTKASLEQDSIDTNDDKQKEDADENDIKDNEDEQDD